MKRSRTLAATGGALLLGCTGVGLAAASAAPGDGARAARTETRTHLSALNNSGVKGMAEVDVRRRKLDIDVDARNLLADMPHAQHIHFGAQARHECPTVADDRNNDHRLTTTDGAGAYGPIKVSLTTRGGTGAASGLAVTRFPTAPGGEVHYDRQARTKRAVARAIRNGEGVVVIHGVDYNNNGKYDFGGAGKSELDKSLPAEATDPAACGVLKVRR